MKKYLIGLFFYFTFTASLFAAEPQRITFMDLGPDGSQRNTRTVNAVFLAWRVINVRQEGNLRVEHYSSSLCGNEWDDWDFLERRPMVTLSLSQEFNAYLRDFTAFPNFGDTVYFGNGITLLIMFWIPLGQRTPFSWSTDGRSFNKHFRMYLVVD